MIIVILAAGVARRMGQQKLLLPVDGEPLIQRVLAAAAPWHVVVVTGEDVAVTLGATPFCIVRNDAPERGMAHSLRLGNAVVPDNEPIAVLVADLPDVTTASIERVINAYDDSVDVVVPSCEGIFAHPVIFGPRARAMIADLDDGDTIHRLRDDARLRRRIVETHHSALRDIDTPHDYAQRTGLRDEHVETTP
jgi:molybdenum cofactor cytidylyltransferase